LEAVTYDRRGESFGRLVRFRDSIGKWHEWNMPMTLLSGSCEDLRAQLLGLGLEIDPRGRAKLPSYLFHSTPKRRVLAALSVGWHDDAFVLPDEVFGDADIYYQSVSASTAEFDQRGSLDDWRGAIASLAPGNMPVMLGLSAGFAGPLMTLAHIENCGLHFVGESSTGKTTAVQAAASVWGPPALVRTWRATSNGLEAAAAESNDTLLVLDEIGESDARVVGEVVYAIGNGRGKARADRKGYSRPIARWRTVLLSSGEKTLEAHMAEAGRKTRAGQSVRLLDIPATGEHGAFDNLHGRDSGRAFADEIKTATARLYGTAGREFVRFLVANHNEDYGAILKQYADRIPTDGGQEARAARQLALVGMAGELATKAGITGWKPGAALEAAIEAFQVWRERRGSGNAERRQILESVRDFVDAHGDSRFSGLNQCESHKVINRAGYTENAGAATDYLFTPGGMREAVQGHDLSRALTVLHAAGWLHTKSAGNHRVQRKVDGKNKGLYCIRLPDDGAAQEAA
jgi:putative DNA primase/helicase